MRLLYALILFMSTPDLLRAAEPRSRQAELFPLTDVRLLDGPFKAAQEVDRRHLLAHEVDRLLAPFRAEAGLEPRAAPYGSWESGGLGGQSAGHYLSALAMMHAATEDAELKRRLDYMVADLAECQRANGDGYVGGVPGGKALWAEVAAGQLRVTGFGLNDRWVPWYNLHKTFAGLRDAYRIGGNAQARDVLVALAEWCDRLLANLTDEQVQQMLRAEHGGMNEVLADVYAITGDARYLALARRFCDRAVLDPLMAGRDELTGKHANTQIPKVIGFRRIASLDPAGHSEGLRRAAVAFWENVTGKRSVAIGGNSVNEHFHPPDNFASMLEDRTGPETCNTYNMLRLTEGLFQDDPAARYADFYERALYNHILASQHPRRGGFVYFTPMRPRHYRVYSQAGQAFWCCVGTGYENHAKYGQFIYARGSEGDDLFVNLFIASELRWHDRGVTLRQETAFPDEPRTRLTFTLATPARFALRIRRPHWADGEGFAVTVNGAEQPTDAAPSSYVAIEREWKTGDVVEVRLPMRVGADPLPDGSNAVAFRYGPIVLAAATPEAGESVDFFAREGRSDHVPGGRLLPLHDSPAIVTDDDPAQLAKRLLPVAGRPLTFALPGDVRPERFADLKLVPFFRLHESRYVLYWRVLSPDGYAAEQRRVQAEERERLKLEEVTLDRVAPGEQQSEVDHHFRGERTNSGHFRDRAWRDAGGWFSYELKGRGGAPSDLFVTYWGADRGRAFTVFAGDAKVADVTLDGRRGEVFFTERYPLPDGVDTSKPVTVKFVARDDSIAGGVFDLRLVRRN